MNQGWAAPKSEFTITTLFSLLFLKRGHLNHVLENPLAMLKNLLRQVETITEF